MLLKLLSHNYALFLKEMQFLLNKHGGKKRSFLQNLVKFYSQSLTQWLSKKLNLHRNWGFLGVWMIQTIHIIEGLTLARALGGLGAALQLRQLGHPHLCQDLNLWCFESHLPRLIRLAH